ncbi:response regulator [Methylocapsa sp. D3K7]|uniref:response regulator n=1 Tax=Methylocapsa sp. D3K7 TaxID=3041435 RepID=UPI00244E763E|nr:response regulator [Methylocapsa sp. D3K7]WGJ13850.1 response regulator [Methylocapsa sp. D3K7]
MADLVKPDLSKHRILVVEDEALIAFEVGDIIKTAGGTVAGPFATVDEALRIIESENISAAILDMELWEDTSLFLARRLSDKNIPFLFYTAHSDKIDVWGAAEIVKKPATSATLVSALAGLISKNFTQPATQL